MSAMAASALSSAHGTTPSTVSETPRLAVVVPTCKRPALLAQCLHALAAQDLSSADWEIVIADDAASEATRDQVEQFARKSKVPIRYVPVHGAHGPAAARNAGWRSTSALLIAFTDDDCIPDRSWLREALAAFDRDPTLSVVTGRTMVPLPPRPTDSELDTAGLETAEFITANCFCRRAALESIGGFDERFRLAWREDSDLQFTFLENNARIAKVASVIVIHPVRPARWGISLFQQRKCLFEALLYKKHPSLYRGRIWPGTPWHYYAACLFLVVAIIAALAGGPWLAIAAFALWFMQFAIFCTRRLRRTSRSFSHVAEMIVTSALIPPLSIFWRCLGALKFRTLFW